MPSKLIFIAFAFSALLYGCASAPEGKPQQQPQTKVKEEKPLSPEEQKKKEAKDEFFRGLMAMQHGNLSNAEQHFIEALKLEPESYNTRLYLASVYEKTNKNMLACDQYIQAKKIKPEDARAYIGLIQDYLQMGVKKSAVDAGEEGLKNGVPVEDMAAALGWAYFQNGDLVQAEKYLNISKEKIKDPAPINNLGLVYFNQGKYLEALANFKEAGELNPKSILVPYFTALAEMKLGKENEALAALKEGLKRDPELEKKVESYRASFFPYTDPGDLSPLFTKIKAEQGQEKEKAGEGKPQQEPKTNVSPSPEAK